MDKELIDNLWRWFYNNEQKIIYCIDNEIVEEQQEIVRNIDNLVLDLGRFSWEIAPGNNKPWSFTISPNGDKELLKKTKAIIKEAPELKSWEFNYCKPAKNWDRKFSLYDENVNLLQVNASSWNYIVIPLSEEKYEITIEAKNIKHLDAETAKNAANLVILNEIGEESKIQHVSVVNIVSKLENKYASQKTDIKKLREQFGS